MPEIGEIRKAKEIGYKSPRTRYIWVACSVCGQERWVRSLKGIPTTLRCNNCALKSEEHRTKSSNTQKGERGHNWQGGKVTQICLQCSKLFGVAKSQIKYGDGKFCSHSCSDRYNLQHATHDGPNKTEIKLLNIIIQSELPFEFTGTGNKFVGHCKPDFTNTNSKKQVIELFGNYWHTISDVPKKIEHYKKHGYDCLIVWENELEGMPTLIARLMDYSSRKYGLDDNCSIREERKSLS